jgi:hypothetical protein
MKNIFILILLAGWSSPVWAGTEILARLESTSDVHSWANLDVFVENGLVRVNVNGPWSRGSLIYDEKNYMITLVDDTNKIIVPVSQSDQTVFKMTSYLVAGKMRGQLEGADDAVKLAYQLARDNAQALFNGPSVLTQKGVRMDGLLCDLYESQTGGVKNRQVWMTPLKATGMTSGDYETLWSLTRLAVDLLGEELSQVGADTTAFLQGYSNLQFPVHAALYVGGKVSSRFKLIKIRHRDLSAGTFDTPTGYRTLTLLDIIQQGIKGNS